MSNLQITHNNIPLCINHIQEQILNFIEKITASYCLKSLIKAPRRNLPPPFCLWSVTLCFTHVLAVFLVYMIYFFYHSYIRRCQDEEVSDISYLGALCCWREQAPDRLSCRQQGITVFSRMYRFCGVFHRNVTFK